MDLAFVHLFFGGGASLVWLWLIPGVGLVPDFALVVSKHQFCQTQTPFSIQLERHAQSAIMNSRTLPSPIAQTATSAAPTTLPAQGEACSTKAKVGVLSISTPTAMLTSDCCSRAASAKTKRPCATSACCSAGRINPRRSARPSWTGTGAAWPGSASRYPPERAAGTRGA